MEVGRKGDRRSERIQIFILRISKKRESRVTCKRQSKKSRRSNEGSVGNREKMIQRRYQEKAMNVRCDGMSGNELRCGDMRIKEEGKDGENARKICEMGVDWETLGYMVKEEVKLDKLRLRGAKRAWGYKERLRVGKGSEWARRCLREIEGRKRERDRKSYMEEEGVRQRKIKGEGKNDKIWRRIE